MKFLAVIPVLVIVTMSFIGNDHHISEKAINNVKSVIMRNGNYSTSFLVEQNPEEVYNAIMNVREWWSEEIEGPTNQLNKEWLYHYKDIHLCKIKLVEIVPHKKVVWEIMENSFNFVKDKEEWVGNRIIFDISREGDKTKLTFTQIGLTSSYECYEVCRDGWNNYINHSLYKLITTGKGEPNPKEGEGFNKELADKWKLNE